MVVTKWSSKIKVKWRLTEYPPYSISSTGKVIGFKGFMKLQMDRYGYLTVKINYFPFKRHFFVHRLVAQAFIPNPNNKPQVNHKDGDKTNNTVSNLEWVTNEENVEHFIKSLKNNYEI